MDDSQVPVGGNRSQNQYKTATNSLHTAVALRLISYAIVPVCVAKRVHKIQGNTGLANKCYLFKTSE